MRLLDIHECPSLKSEISMPRQVGVRAPYISSLLKQRLKRLGACEIWTFEFSLWNIMGQNVTGFISEIEWHIDFEAISLKTYFAHVNRDIILEHNSILRNGIKSSRVKNWNVLHSSSTQVYWPNFDGVFRGHFMKWLSPYKLLFGVFQN